MEEQTISVQEAATLKGLTRAAIYKIIARSELTNVAPTGQPARLRLAEVQNYKVKRPGRKRKHNEAD